GTTVAGIGRALARSRLRARRPVPACSRAPLARGASAYHPCWQNRGAGATSFSVGGLPLGNSRVRRREGCQSLKRQRRPLRSRLGLGNRKARTLKNRNAFRFRAGG